MWCRQLVSPPRMGPGCWSGAGHKAGNKVGFAPWNIPADGAALADKMVPVGYSVALTPAGVGFGNPGRQ